MRLIYTIALYLLTPLVLLRLLWQGLGNRSYWVRWGERFGYVNSLPQEQPVIWIHAVSVGEVQAATPLVQRIFLNHPVYQVVMTTVTPTGAEMVRQRFGGDVSHFYLPYDLPGATTRFITRLQPRLLIVMETELWPNLYQQCHVNGIRLLLVNARLSDKSYKGYLWLKALTKQTLSHIGMIAAQSDEDSKRLVALGADPKKVQITGNMKFDVNMPPSILEEGQAIRRLFSEHRPVWIAASTHDGEEKIVLSAHRRIMETYPQALLVLAPRHPERFDKVTDLAIGYGFNTVRKTEAQACPVETQVFILDTLGELPAFYAAVDVAFVAGSLLPFGGGHNVLEPAALGIPVISGANIQNFREINRLLIDHGAEIQVAGKDDLADKVMLLLADANLRHQMGEQGKQIVETNRGSTERVMKLIAESLPIN